jgi:hypothetical protein
MIGTEFSERQQIPWRLVGWGGAALLLAVRYVAGFPWTLSDYVVMGAMFAIAGGSIEVAMRSSTDWTHRLGAIVAVLTGFLTVWVNLAVGMIGSEDNPYNFWFGAVLAIAIGGSLLSRSSISMALILAITALAQALISIIGLAADPRGGVFSLAFAALWLLSAGLYWLASRQDGVFRS